MCTYLCVQAINEVLWYCLVLFSFLLITGRIIHFMLQNVWPQKAAITSKICGNNSENSRDQDGNQGMCLHISVSC